MISIPLMGFGRRATKIIVMTKHSTRANSAHKPIIYTVTNVSMFVSESKAESKIFREKIFN